MLKILKASEFEEKLHGLCCERYFTFVEIQIAVDGDMENISNATCTKLREDTRNRPPKKLNE